MYDKLNAFIGSWGDSQDDTNAERCEWFDGQKHIICSWAAEINGKYVSGKSIISYSTMLEKYTYYGFNSLGRNSYQTGEYKDNKFVFSGQIKRDEKIINIRTTLIFSPDGQAMELIEDKEENGIWVNMDKKTVYKLKESK